eukprot:1900600-Alexandrium_andersonii.AAC.1
MEHEDIFRVIRAVGEATLRRSQHACISGPCTTPSGHRKQTSLVSPGRTAKSQTARPTTMSTALLITSRAGET